MTKNQIIAKKVHPHISFLEVLIQKDNVILYGNAKTFYGLQLLLTAVQEQFPNHEIVNNVVVEG